MFVIMFMFMVMLIVVDSYTSFVFCVTYSFHHFVNIEIVNCLRVLDVFPEYEKPVDNQPNRYSSDVLESPRIVLICLFN